MVSLYYEGNPEQKNQQIAFIGKGVCYDSGGLSIKPTDSMLTMHTDKAGACAVLSAFMAAVDLKLKVNLSCTIPFVENSVDGNSYRPGDIIVTKKGITVEITNTDAEGRLILADAMIWAQELYNPKQVIELSTLTGACVVALGERIAGVFANNDQLA